MPSEMDLISEIIHRYNMGQILPRMIWFDDALLSQYEIGFPLLKKYNIRKGIVIAIPTSYVGKTFPWEDPKVNIPTMSIEQIREMVKYGCQVASHTVTHTRLDKLSEENQLWEIKESKRWIIKNLGIEPKFFVAPQDKYTDYAFDMAKAQYCFARPPYANCFHIVTHHLRDDIEHKLSKRWGQQILNVVKNFETELKIEKITRKLINL